MLNSVTKSKINSARDILVGKIPDPKGQIDQITNALIYKFMDDQDRVATSLPGGRASFFVGDVSEYAWHKLFDSKLTNQQRANMYIEGLQRLSVSTHLPELFKSIFKEAFLPFRDAATIAMFLDNINEFDYNHSEELGNAFEYLLSVMGSQGDAGQFRTPRHIIKFIVDIIKPQPHETIMDPACGTAGFLVEAYNYIASNNNLTQSQKAVLANNLTGVDIDPGMAKIARVNLYLHGFKTPKITEDDTLTNPALWGTKYDVILANPPFMTPKGGIKPHDKFVKASKAEVLFTDYISEHLKLEGRAGIVVPEGIIFQSATAYKALRKKLVEDNYLLAVISLPSGVFQPYSGVKTSILILDRKRAKASDSVLFIKINNDGFDLSAQRRENTKNDLPEALRLIANFEKGIEDQNLPDNVQIIFKSTLRESGDYNLSGDRYKVATDYSNSKYPMVKIGDIFETGRGRVINKIEIEANPGIYPVYSSQTTNNGCFGLINSYDFDGDYITWTTDGAYAGKVFHRTGKFNCTNVCGTLKLKSGYNYSLEFIAQVLDTEAYKHVIQVGNPKLMNNVMSQINIPLPPLSVQEQIVAEISSYQKIIDGAKLIITNWKPKIDIDPSWEKVKLGDVCEIKSGGTPSTSEKDYYESGDIPWLKSEICKDEIVTTPKCFITKKGFENSSAKYLNEDTTLIALVGATIGKTGLLKFKATTNQNIAGLYPKNLNSLSSIYLYLACQSLYNQFLNLGDGGFKMASLSFIKELQIPLPPISIQNEIVERIESERALVDSAKQLIDIYAAKIKSVIAKVWADVEE
jgi:type I restriction enzyme M protein